MPTVILLDVSLSMFRPIQCSDGAENITRYSLATATVNGFLDYLNDHGKLEYVALAAFSSNFEVMESFTRDFDLIRAKLPHIEEGDKTCIDQALHGVNQLILNKWGCQTPVQIVIITDGNLGVGSIGRNRIIQSLPLPPLYPARFHVLHMAVNNDPNLVQALPLYNKIVEQSNSAVNCSVPNVTRGSVQGPDQLTLASVSSMVSRFCDNHYSEFTCTLHCGHLSAKVQLFPPPISSTPNHSSHTPSQHIHVIGFISQQDLGTPIAISKHLVLPLPQNGVSSDRRENFSAKTPTKEGTADAAEDDLMDPSKVPNFCVLLHGALKVEGMAGVVSLAEGWWGAVAAFCDSSRARRSCLLLSALQPGAAAAPWLGPLSALGPWAGAAGEPPAEAAAARAVRSYSGGGGAAWARPHALLADVQKVLRHARKLPDKTQHLYKELNRLRRSAISLGFSELLVGVAAALERERAALPPSAAAAAQLAHAASALASSAALDIKHTMQPLP